MIAAAQYTIVDLSDPIISNTAPSSPVIDMLWLDTSKAPSVLKRWTGTEWEIVSEVSIGGRNIIRHSGNFTSVPEDWVVVTEGSATLSSSSELGANMLKVESVVGTNNRAAIEQNRTYPLEFGTTYVYHAMYRISRSAATARHNPMSYRCQLMDDPTETPTLRNASLREEILTEDKVDAGEWEHTVLRFTTCSQPLSQPDSCILFQPVFNGTITKNAGDSEEDTTQLWVQWVMLEKGDTPSDWSPAPEDAQEEIDKTQQDVDALVSRVEKTELKIEDAAIIATVLSSEEYKTRIESMEANMELNKSEFDVRFTEINQQIIDNEANDSAFRNEVTSWMNFSKDAVLEIGKSDSEFKMNLSNTQLSFLYKGTEMAYFGTDNGMYIHKAVIKDSLTVGNITMVGDSKGRMLWV